MKNADVIKTQFLWAVQTAKKMLAYEGIKIDETSDTFYKYAFSLFNTLNKTSEIPVIEKKESAEKPDSEKEELTDEYDPPKDDDPYKEEIKSSWA
jgi:hypothetical protein